MTEGGLPGILFLIILQDQGIRQLGSCLEIALHAGFFIQVQFDLDAAGRKSGQFSLLVRFGILQVQDILQQGVSVCHLAVQSFESLVAAERGYLFHSGLLKCIVEEVQLGRKCFIHGVVIRVAFNVNNRHRQHAGCEIPGRGLGTLLGVGIEADFSVLRLVVLRDQLLTFQPFAEILAHHGLQNTAPQRKLAGIRGPLEPCVGRRGAQKGSFPGKRGADIVAAQDHDLFQGIIITDVRCLGYLVRSRCLRLGDLLSSLLCSGVLCRFFRRDSVLRGLPRRDSFLDRAAGTGLRFRRRCGASG